MNIIEKLKLTPEDVEQIIVEYARRAIKRRLRESEPQISVDTKLPIEEQIYAFIDAQPSKCCMRYQISHRFKHTPHPRRLEAIAKLIADKRIEVRYIKAKNNRRTHVYYIPEN